MFTLYGASSIFNIGNNIISQLEHLLGGALILILGAMGLHYIFSHQAAKGVALLLLALIPAMFIFDPHGAQSVLTSAVHAVGG